MSNDARLLELEMAVEKLRAAANAESSWTHARITALEHAARVAAPARHVQPTMDELKRAASSPAHDPAPATEAQPTDFIRSGSV